jgi:hypothetical protein
MCWATLQEARPAMPCAGHHDAMVRAMCGEIGASLPWHLVQDGAASAAAAKALAAIALHHQDCVRPAAQRPQHRAGGPNTGSLALERYEMHSTGYARINNHCGGWIFRRRRFAGIPVLSHRQPRTGSNHASTIRDLKHPMSCRIIVDFFYETPTSQEMGAPRGSWQGSPGSRPLSPVPPPEKGGRRSWKCVRKGYKRVLSAFTAPEQAYSTIRHDLATNEQRALYFASPLCLPLSLPSPTTHSNFHQRLYKAT